MFRQGRDLRPVSMVFTQQNRVWQIPSDTDFIQGCFSVPKCLVLVSKYREDLRRMLVQVTKEILRQILAFVNNRMIPTWLILQTSRKDLIPVDAKDVISLGINA